MEEPVVATTRNPPRLVAGRQPLVHHTVIVRTVDT